MSGDFCEFFLVIDHKKLEEAMPIPLKLDGQIGHLEDVNLRRKGTNILWPYYISRVKKEDIGLVILQFSSGWKKVFRENDIEINGAVSFTYNGNSIFTFMVFGRDGVSVKPKGDLLRGAEDELVDNRRGWGWLPDWLAVVPMPTQRRLS